MKATSIGHSGATREDDLIFGKPDGRNPRSGTKLLSYRIGMRISSDNSKEEAFCVSKKGGWTWASGRNCALNMPLSGLKALAKSRKLSLCRPSLGDWVHVSSTRIRSSIGWDWDVGLFFPFLTRRAPFLSTAVLSFVFGERKCQDSPGRYTSYTFRLLRFDRKTSCRGSDHSLKKPIPERPQWARGS